VSGIVNQADGPGSLAAISKVHCNASKDGLAPDTGKPGFAVYLHWPFCAAKCPYCDFNSHVRHAGVDQQAYIDGFRAEIAAMRKLSGPQVVTSIFFGGGTPSLMDPETVAAILDAVREAWVAPEGIEITLEANPSSVEAGRFRGYRAAGVNRVSMGVQALNDADLKRLGRLHDRAEALKAIGLAREIFPRMSFDLIYARPDQTPQAWDAELKEAIALAADHLSLYQLTIEEGTPFYGLHKAGKLIVPDGELSAELYELTQSVCEAHGLPAYEVSNHARPGAESRHNLTYWREPDSKVIHCSQCLANRRMRMRIWAMRVHAVELWMDFSQSLASLRDLPSHANVRSTTQRRGSTLKPFWSSQRLTTSMVQSPLPVSACFSLSPLYPPSIARQASEAPPRGCKDVPQERIEAADRS
jgi:putative oxygen-independent coproporphyrinogen III oxidase